MTDLDITAAVRDKKAPIFKTETEKHRGWVENLKNERRTMKDSIKKCISGGYTKDKEKALQILEHMGDDVSEPALSRHSSRQGHSINSYNRFRALN